jgi:ABC-type transport system involved in multi-copper enzyme maturation permease subunit
VNALRAELLKAVTTRLLLWLGLGLLGFIALVVSTHIGTSDRLSLATESTQRSAFDAAGLAAVTAVLFGAFLITTEYNHGTINQSFLAVPARERLVAAKVAAALVVGAALALLADLATLVLAEIWYAGRGETLHVGGGTAAPLLGTIGASVVAAVVGLGVGALLRRQTGSIVLILLWLLIGENIIALIPGAARYAPGHAIAAIVAAHADANHDRLAVWAAVATGVVYGAVLVVLGALAVTGSDAPTSGD